MKNFENIVIVLLIFILAIVIYLGYQHYRLVGIITKAEQEIDDMYKAISAAGGEIGSMYKTFQGLAPVISKLEGMFG